MKINPILFLLSLFSLFIISYWITQYYLKETFEDEPTETVLTSQTLNLQSSLKSYTTLQLPNKGWDYVLFKLVNQQPLSLYKSPRYITLDVKDYTHYGQNYPYTILPKGYFCILTHPQKREDFKCGFDWTQKKIGYVDRIDKNFIDAFLFGYRTSAKLSPIGIEQLDQLESILKDYDGIVLYVIPKSPLASILSKQFLSILDINQLDLNRMKVTYPNLEMEPVVLDEMFGSTHKLQSNTPTISMVYTSLYQVNLKPQIPIEPFITQLKLSKEFTDKDFKCFGDESVQSKFLCESPYNSQGEPKNVPTVWDKKCQSNSECPFYQANKNYPNQRGKCQRDGTCEMPVGVLRVSYTKYMDLDPYQPFCYQCKNTKDKNCCEDQERLVSLQTQNPQVNYTFLKSADYAFENDTEDRKNYKLPTTIFLPD